MSLVDEMHAAHKARLHRMNACAYQAPAPRPAPAEYPSFNVQTAHYHQMWFFDLISVHAPIGFTNKVEDILRAVARYYGVSKLDLISARRNKEIVKPRMVAAFLAKTLTSKSLPEIGRRIGGRDHTTILHSVRKIQDQLDSGDIELASQISEISVGFGR